ncbi:MAG: hypothetical protein MI748_10795, partial [Opitutales bacterium]|nr:hypothetical protein [Opitutales bacterium]
LFDINWKTPAGPHPYASDSWFDLVKLTAEEARKNGVEFGFHNCSGWSSSGGPWITPEKSMKWVVWTEITVDPSSPDAILQEPQPIEGIHEKSLENYNKHHRDIRFYEDIAVVAFPKPTHKFEIENWPQKALVDRKGSRTEHFVPDHQRAPEDGTIAQESIVHLSEHLEEDGTLHWRPEQGEWVVIRLGYASNGKTNHPASTGGIGLELDKLDPSATDLHWEAFLERIVDVAGGKNTVNEMLIDSYEVGVQNWTSGFEQFFSEHNGYDLMDYLPIFAGYTVDDVETTERVMWDLRRTVAAMMKEHYFLRFRDHCRKNGITFVTEPYGFGSFDAVEIARISDIPMGEFWYPEMVKNWKYWMAKVAASGAHLSGRNVVSAEAFTSWFGDFKATPRDLKPVMDKFFTMGINRNQFHTYTHQPAHDSVKPGMTMSRFGSNFDRNNTWFEEASEFFEYMQRCQWIFQSGQYVADVLKLYGDERAFNNLVGSDIVPVFVEGHNYDIGNTNLLKDLSVDDQGHVRVRYEGKLLDARYRLIHVLQADLMLPENIKLLGQLAEKGATIVSPRPIRSPSLKDANSADRELDNLVKKYWDGGIIREQDEYPKLLADLVDDCETSEKVFFCQTRIGDDAYYFVVNADPNNRDLSLTFRVTGKIPEIWDPMTGRMESANQWETTEDDRTTVHFHLPAEGSRFVVFREETDLQNMDTNVPTPVEILDVDGPWSVKFDPEWGPVIFDRLHPYGEHTDDEIKYFSGTATYTTTFDLGSTPNQAILLDLGEVGTMARVTLNGQEYPLLWQAPYLIDVSEVIKAGKNIIRIRVTNSWNNRLIGDSHLPAHPEGIPDWVLNGEPLPEDTPRRTWTFHEFQKPDDALFRDGLIGPVKVLAISE